MWTVSRLWANAFWTPRFTTGPSYFSRHEPGFSPQELVISTGLGVPSERRSTESSQSPVLGAVLSPDFVRTARQFARLIAIQDFTRYLMTRALILTLALLVLTGPSALAQFNFVGPGSTAEGDYLRGVGVAAFGMGVYNQQTAVANSINADTAMRVNEYIYAALMNENKMNAEHRVRSSRGPRISTPSTGIASSILRRRRMWTRAMRSMLCWNS